MGPDDELTPWVIVGCGRVGSALALFAERHGIEVAAAWDRDAPPAVPATRQLSGSLDNLKDYIKGSAVFLTVSDEAIGAVAGAMAHLLGEAEVVAHCSGSLSSDILTEAGVTVPVASVHPLLAIADPSEAVERFRDAVWTVEGSSAAVWWARGWLAKVDVEPITIASNRKTLYHAAAVTSAGLVVALMDVAFELAAAAGLEPEQARRMLLPLAHSSLDNLESLDPAHALTGPIARGDNRTIADHIDAMSGLGPTTVETYRVLTERSRALLKSGGPTGS